VLAFALPAGASASAEKSGPEFSLREWHVSDGLPTEEVSSVVFGKDGFLWTSNLNGITRFDGTRFWRYPLPPAGGQASLLARAMVESPEHGMVVAPVTGGLVAFDRGGFCAIAMPLAVAGRIFNGLFCAPDGALWCSTNDGTICRISRDAAASFRTADDLHGVAVVTFGCGASGEVWIANGTNLYRHQNGTLAPFATGRSRAEMRVGSSKRGGPWIAADDRLFRIEGDCMIAVVQLPERATAHYIQTLLEDHAGALWIGTRSQDVYVYSGGTVSHVATGSDDIMGLAEDADGNIWAGTHEGGLRRLRPARVRLYARNAGLLNNGSSAICEDVGGTIWLANRDGGIARLLPDGAVKIVPPPPEWSVFSAVSVSPDSKNGIWATAGPGIFRIDDPVSPVMRKVEHPRVPIIRCMYTARNGALWISVDPDRIGRFEAGKLTTFGSADGFEGKQVRYITEDSAGRIWCGTSDGRLFRQEGARFVPVSVGCETGSINAILLEGNGTIWLGTTVAGLVVRQKNVWRTVDAAAGLPDNFVTQIVPDDRGSFWIGSPSGIYRLSQQDLLGFLSGAKPRLDPALIGKNEGLSDLVCMAFYQPAAWKSRDGKVWFTTKRGVVRIDPGLAGENLRPPPVRIEEISCDDCASVSPQGFSPKSGFRKLGIGFSVLCLGTPEWTRVRCRLEGFDTEWQTAPATHVAVYPQLRPGTYRFQVRAGIKGGPADESTAEVEFTVAARWWETWYLRGAVGLALAGAIAFGVRKFSHRRLRARLERIKRESAVERERTRIAQNLHDDLGAGLTRVSLLTQDDDPGNATAQMEKIYTVVSGLTRSMDEIVWAVNPKYDNVDDLAYYIGNYAQAFLGDAGIRCRILTPGPEAAHKLTSQMRHHLFLCCKEALTNVVKHAGATEVSLGIRVDERWLVVAVADDGSGISPRALMATPGKSGRGNGLANMKARMAELGGSCDVLSNSPRGTLVRFFVPLPAKAAS